MRIKLIIIIIKAKSYICELHKGDKKNNLICQPWHACPPVGEGDWGGVGPGERLTRGFIVSLTNNNSN